MHRSLATTAAFLTTQLSPAFSDTIRCGPWNVDGNPHGNSVSVSFDDQKFAWNDGHVQFAALQADETPLGRIYVGKGEVYFAYVSEPQGFEKKTSFKPSKVVRIPQDASSVRFLTLICGDK